jgi:hypothetical protein
LPRLPTAAAAAAAALTVVWLGCRGAVWPTHAAWRASPPLFNCRTPLCTGALARGLGVLPRTLTADGCRRLIGCRSQLAARGSAQPQGRQQRRARCMQFHNHSSMARYIFNVRCRRASIRSRLICEHPSPSPVCYALACVRTRPRPARM